ncbi:MAG: site-2 protease family protein [Opitutales bacterium]|nr:site-2 protease family protein [Opitutales bacterium]
MEYWEPLRWAIIQFIVLVLCISLHEFGHAWTADKRGDLLPRAQGRVTLNPVAHIDPLGTLAIPGMMIFLPLLFGGLPFGLIGWGKPVQVSLANAKTRRADDILITLSGPGMNFLLALVGAITFGALWGINSEMIPETVYDFFLMFIMVNCSLAVFNLMPLPPLDGSRVLRYAVGMTEETFSKIARNAWWILLLAINLPPENPVLGMIFRPVVGFFAKGFLYLSEFISGLF